MIDQCTVPTQFRWWWETRSQTHWTPEPLDVPSYIELGLIINSFFPHSLQNHWANIKEAEHNVVFHREPKLHVWPTFLLLVRTCFSRASFQRNITAKGADNSHDLKDTFWNDKGTRGRIKSFDLGLTTPFKQIRFGVLSLTHTFFHLSLHFLSSPLSSI